MPWSNIAPSLSLGATVGAIVSVLGLPGNAAYAGPVACTVASLALWMAVVTSRDRKGTLPVRLGRGCAAVSFVCGVLLVAYPDVPASIPAEVAWAVTGFGGWWLVAIVSAQRKLLEHAGHYALWGGRGAGSRALSLLSLRGVGWLDSISLIVALTAFTLILLDHVDGVGFGISVLLVLPVAVIGFASLAVRTSARAVMGRPTLVSSGVASIGAFGVVASGSIILVGPYLGDRRAIALGWLAMGCFVGYSIWGATFLRAVRQLMYGSSQ